ncbi:MAG: hypothetical protein P1U40_03200 [Coxiellaceae bacterium]|nr:hypothetical protein [Coxiellaceae bacterium]
MKGIPLVEHAEFYDQTAEENTIYAQQVVDILHRLAPQCAPLEAAKLAIRKDDVAALKVLLTDNVYLLNAPLWPSIQKHHSVACARLYIDTVSDAEKKQKYLAVMPAIEFMHAMANDDLSATTDNAMLKNLALADAVRRDSTDSVLQALLQK